MNNLNHDGQVFVSSMDGHMILIRKHGNKYKEQVTMCDVLNEKNKG